MQSILIVGTIEKARVAAGRLCKENKVLKFDIDTIQTEKTVGIGDIRNLQKKLFLKPLQSETKAVILEAFFGMTIDSQNAFLKALEEPPVHTIIMILVTSLDFILPTILSRCSLINLDKIKKLSSEEIEDNLKIISSLKNGGTSQSLPVAQNNSKDRETALQFLESLIISVHSVLDNKNTELTTKDLQKILKSLQKTYTIIKTTNVAPRFALENLFLNLF
jgi:DNA polymerase III delta prime subunit